MANLKIRLGDHAIKDVGETTIFESKAARVVRHKDFSQETLVYPTVDLQDHAAIKFFCCHQNFELI